MSQVRFRSQVRGESPAFSMSWQAGLVDLVFRAQRGGVPRSVERRLTKHCVFAFITCAYTPFKNATPICVFVCRFLIIHCLFRSHAFDYRGASLIRQYAPSQDPSVGLCLGPYGGPRGWAVSYERGTPADKRVLDKLTS